MSRPFFARGLAASAVAALAVTGLAAPAHADAPLSVSLISQFTGHASTKQDVAGNAGVYTVTLTAKTSAGASVDFSYRPAGADDSVAWSEITSPVTASSAGYATVDWQSPPVGSYDLRATASDGTATVDARRSNVQIDGLSDAVELAAGPLPYFTQPYESEGHVATYATVTGTTSAANGTVALSWWDAADGTFHGQTNASVAFLMLKSGAPSGMPDPSEIDGGSFSGSLDLTGFDAAPGAVVPVAAELGSDDVQPLVLDAQAISDISVTFGAVTSTDVPGTARVVDQNGSPIRGVQVRRSSDDTIVGYTNSSGAVALSQATDTTESYYANANDDAVFDAADGDQATTATAPAYVPVATSVTPLLADGTVFDLDEYADGDVALQVLDQEGHPMSDAGATVPYALYPSDTPEPEPMIGTTDADGRIAAPTELAAGSYTLAFGEPGGTAADNTHTAFTVGDSTLSLSPTAGSTASGGTITYTGTLAVGGKPLPGRSIGLTYIPAAASDAGIGAAHALTATVTTGSDGTFTTTVQDPSSAPAGSADETGTLTATTADNVASGGSTLTGNADETVSASARFVAAPWVPPTDPQPPVTGGDPQPPVTGGDPQPPATPDPQNTVQLTGSGRQGRTDRLRIVVSPDLAGRKVILRRLVHGRWRKAAVGRIDENGVLVLKVRDRNRAHRTTYKVTVLSGAHATSNTVTVS